MESESPFIYSQLGERVCVCPTTHEKQTVTCRSRAKARTVGPNPATPRTPTMAKQWRSSDKPSASRRYQVALAGCRRPSRFSSSHRTGYFALLFASSLHLNAPGPRARRLPSAEMGTHDSKAERKSGRISIRKLHTPHHTRHGLCGDSLRVAPDRCSTRPLQHATGLFSDARLRRPPWPLLSRAPRAWPPRAS